MTYRSSPQSNFLICKTGLAHGPRLQELLKGSTREDYTSAWPVMSFQQTLSMSHLLPLKSHSEQPKRCETACVQVQTHFASYECALCAMFILFKIFALALTRLHTADRAGVLESQGFAT